MTVKKKEIEIIEKNSQDLVAAIDSIEHFLVPGKVLSEIDSLIENAIHKVGGTPSLKNYRGFPKASCLNIDEQITNAIPGTRQLIDGCLLKMQVGMFRMGYHTKIQHTYPIGEISPKAKHLMLTTKLALKSGMQKAKPDNTIGDISHAIQDKIEKEGFSVPREFTGHGIGKELHESPNVPNFGKPGLGLSLEENMVLQLLPMANEGGKQLKILDDNFTAVTADGGLSCLSGHVICVEKESPRILTFSPRDHIIDETKGEAVVIIPGIDRLHVRSLEDFGIHNIIKPESRKSLLYAGANIICERTRSFLSSELEELENLINEPGVTEEELHNFFLAHTNFLLGSDYQSIRSKIILPGEYTGNLIPDFFLEPITGPLWDIAELKLPNKPIVVGPLNRRRLSHYVHEGCAQLRTYMHYFDNPVHREEIYRRYGIMAYKPRLSLIIGRMIDESPIILRQIEHEYPWVRMITYDDLILKAKNRIIDIE